MSPEEKARQIIDDKLIKSGWVIQDMKDINLSASVGVAVREFPTSTGEADYALFVDGIPVGVIEAKRSEMGENITTAEKQTARYANSKLKYLTGNYRIRFVIVLSDLRTMMISSTVQGRYSLSTDRKHCKCCCVKKILSETT